MYKQLLGTNTSVINAIHAKWSTKINEEIEFRTVAYSFKIDSRTTGDTFSQLIQFKLVHNSYLLQISNVFIYTQLRASVQT